MTVKKSFLSSNVWVIWLSALAFGSLLVGSSVRAFAGTENYSSSEASTESNVVFDSTLAEPDSRPMVVASTTEAAADRTATSEDYEEDPWEPFNELMFRFNR